MTSILVTGGAGYIGSHTCLLLLERNYNLYVIDSFVNSSDESLKRIIKIIGFQNKSNIHIIKGDLRDKSVIDSTFKKAFDNGDSISAVIHFAGFKSVYESIKNPLIYWENNFGITINLLKSMEENDCKTIIFSSSATIYSKADENLIKEDYPLQPLNPYGNTKFAIEKILNDIFVSNPNEWRICNLRYFNPIGAHSSGLIGEDPIGKPNNIFPILLRVASKKISNFNIYGNKWDTYDGTCIRDYVHVMDVAEGHLLAMEFLLKERPQINYLNLGTGSGTSVLDLIKIFQEVNDVLIPYKFVGRREGDLPVVVADNSKCKKILGWQPKRSISTMCRDGWKWQKENPDGYSKT